MSKYFRITAKQREQILIRTAIALRKFSEKGVLLTGAIPINIFLREEYQPCFTGLQETHEYDTPLDIDGRLTQFKSLMAGFDKASLRVVGPERETLRKIAGAA